MANFEAFCGSFSLSTNLLFLKSDINKKKWQNVQKKLPLLKLQSGNQSGRSSNSYRFSAHSVYNAEIKKSAFVGVSLSDFRQRFNLPPAQSKTGDMVIITVRGKRKWVRCSRGMFS